MSELEPVLEGELEVSTVSGAVPGLVAAWLIGFASPHTRRSYAGDVAAWLAFCADHGIEPVHQARRPHLDAWARSQQAADARPRSVARRLAAVSSWYAFLVSEGARPDSPAEQVRRPRIPDIGETPGLTRDEVRRLLAAAREHGSLRSLTLLSLLAHTGLRITEALSRDVEHLGHDQGHRILRLDRKGGKSGRTVLTGPVVRLLEQYLDGRASGPVFVTGTGRRMGQSEAWRMVRRLSRRAELDGAGRISPQSLRVAFITGARDAGVPLEDVQDAAGHADPRQTRRYDRGRHSLDRHASYAVTAWLDGGEPI